MWTLWILGSATLVLVNAENIDCSKKPKSMVDDCCQAMPAFITEEASKACNKKVDGDALANQCEVFKCIFKDINILTADEKIDRASVRALIPKFYGKDWKDAAEISLTKCFAELDKNTNNCEVRAFASCFMRSMVLNCPASVWMNNDGCNEAKAFLDKCVPVFF